MPLRGSIDFLVERARALRLFKRNRKPLKVKVTSALVYGAGLSCRRTAWAMGLEGWEVSHEAVRGWFHCLRRALPKPRPRRRGVVAVDETKLKLGGIQFYVWAARDVRRKEILALRVSWTRSSLDAELFLGDALKACLNRPLILVDKGPWYPWALGRLGLRWRHITFGRRNSIERWFGVLKAKTKTFYNNFPHNATLRSVKAFLETFIGLYNMELGF